MELSTVEDIIIVGIFCGIIAGINSAAVWVAFKKNQVGNNNEKN